MKLFKTLSLVATMLLSGCGLRAADPNVEVVSPWEFQAKLAGDPEGYLLDVRRHDEFAAGHLQGAHLLNWLDTDGFRLGVRNLDKSKKIYIYCRSGRRSGEAARYLGKQGYSVVDMDGGILAWEEAGLSVTTGE